MYLQELFLNENTVLDELTHYKNLPAYTTAQSAFAGVGRSKHYDAMSKFNSFMHENGFRKLGEGAFGAVYEKEGYPWVFKVFHGDPAYLDFLRYAIANQNNPHLPKIKGAPFKITNDTYAIRMEKLSSMGDWYNQEVQRFLRWWHPPITDEQTEFLRSHNAAELIPILHSLAKLCREKNYRLDLHQHNLMRRGPVLVVVDPVVDDKSMEKSEPNMAIPNASHQSTQPGKFAPSSN